MKRQYRSVFLAFLDHAQLITRCEVIVGLAYQEFCDPCNAMKPYVEALAHEHGFPLLEVDMRDAVEPKFSGQIVPLLVVFRNGQAVGDPLNGARTKAEITDYLKEHGVIPQ